LEQFSGGANRLDDLIELLDRPPRAWCWSSGTTVPGPLTRVSILASPTRPLQLETVGFDFSLQALKRAAGEVADRLFSATVLRETLRRHFQKRDGEPVLAGHVRPRLPHRSTKTRRTRRARRDVAGARIWLGGAGLRTTIPLLGLFGAFAYDLVFQIEDLVQKRARRARKTSGDIVL